MGWDFGKGGGGGGGGGGGKLEVDSLQVHTLLFTCAPSHTSYKLLIGSLRTICPLITNHLFRQN